MSHELERLIEEWRRLFPRYRAEVTQRLGDKEMEYPDGYRAAFRLARRLGRVHAEAKGQDSQCRCYNFHLYSS